MVSILYMGLKLIRESTRLLTESLVGSNPTSPTKSTCGGRFSKTQRGHEKVVAKLKTVVDFYASVTQLVE